MNTLLIDTTNNKEIRVGLRVNGKECFIKQRVDYRKAQVALPLIDKLLRKKGISLRDLDSIEVNVSEGSFTGIRVGLSVAQGLGFALKIPVLPAGRQGKKVIY